MYILKSCLLLFQGKWEVPLPKVRGVSEAEVFKVMKSGKTKRELMRQYLSIRILIYQDLAHGNFMCALVHNIHTCKVPCCTLM